MWASLATRHEKLVTTELNLVAPLTPRVATSSPAISYSVSGLTEGLFTTKESAVHLFSFNIVIPYCNITSWFAIKLAEIRTGPILRKKANCKQSTSCENNMLSSHLKYHRCYGHKINLAFHSKRLLKWNGLVFHWCLYNKDQNITWLLRDMKFLFLRWKNISLEEKICTCIPMRPCNVLYLSNS